MRSDVLEQLEVYGGDFEAGLVPIALEDVLTERVGPTPVQPLRPRQPRRPARRWLVGIAAAIATVVLIGGAAWLSRVGSDPAVDQTTTSLPATTAPVPTTASPPVPTAAGVAVGPGRWSVAAMVADGADVGALAGVADEVRSWPGVLAVDLVSDHDAWVAATGLTEDCPGDAGPPCGPGLVAVVTQGWIAETAQRLRSEYGMESMTAAENVAAFIRGYEEAVVAASSPVPLEFDPSPLGQEIPLIGPFVNLSGEQCGQQCDILVELEVGDVVLRAGLELWEDELTPDGREREGGFGIVEVVLAGPGPREELSVAGGGGGRGMSMSDLLISDDGTGGGVAFSSSEGVGQQYYVLAGLPLEAALATFEMADGTRIWQRPLGGMALLVDAADSAGGEIESDLPPGTMISVLDRAGQEIMRIEGTEDADVRVTDLRVDPARLSPGPAQDEEPQGEPDQTPEPDPPNAEPAEFRMPDVADLLASGAPVPNRKEGFDVSDVLRYIDGYVAAMADASHPDPSFDTTNLGTEQVLVPVDPSDIEDERLARDAFAYGEYIPMWVAAGLEGTDTTAQFLINVTIDGDVDSPDGVDFEWFLVTPDNGWGSGNFGFEEGVANLTLLVGDIPYVAIGGLPPEAAVVTTVLTDGTEVWQRPLSGIAIFEDPASTQCDVGEVGDYCVGAEFRVLDVNGTEILRVSTEPSPSGLPFNATQEVS